MKRFNKLLTLGLVGLTAISGGLALSGCNIFKDNTAQTQDVSLTKQQKILTATEVLQNYKAKVNEAFGIQPNQQATPLSVNARTNGVDEEFANYGVTVSSTQDFNDTSIAGGPYEIETWWDFEMMITLAEHFFTEDYFEFNTLYKDTSLEQSYGIRYFMINWETSKLKVYCNFPDYIGQFEISYDSDNNVTQIENKSMHAYDKIIFSTDISRKFDCVISMQAKSSNYDTYEFWDFDLNIYSERTGKYAELSNGNTYSEAKRVEIQTQIKDYDWDSSVLLDKNATDKINDLIG